MSKLLPTSDLPGWAVRRDEDLCLDARKLEMAAGAGAAEAGAGLWKCRDCRRPALVSTQHYIRSFIASTSTMPTTHHPPGSTDNNQARHSHSNKGNLDYLECAWLPIVNQQFG